MIIVMKGTSMSHIDFNDVSQWQGSINWATYPYPIVMIKMSGGDNGLYYDSKANANYYGAKAAGKAIGMYHFAGGGNPENEADFFIAACSPLEENDVLCLDYELHLADPVGWCQRFVNRVHDRTGVWPLVYLNGSTVNSYNWDSVLNNCGLWVAYWNYDPEGDPVISRTYVAQQYTNQGLTAGINGRVDTNAWFGTLAQFKKYGYHAPVAPPAPAPAPQPVPPPTPVPIPPKPDPVPPVDPTPPPAPPAPVPPAPELPGKGILLAFLAAVAAVVAFIISKIR